MIGLNTALTRKAVPRLEDLASVLAFPSAL